MADNKVLTLLNWRSGQVALAAVLFMLAGGGVLAGVGDGLRTGGALQSMYPVRISLDQIHQNPPVRLAKNYSLRGNIAASSSSEQERLSPQSLAKLDLDSISSIDFDEAFKSFRVSSDRSTREEPALKKVSGPSVQSHGFIKNTFRLQEIESPTQGIRQEKRFVLNQTELGSLPLEFFSTSRIYIGRAELLRVLDGKIPEEVYAKVEKLHAERNEVSFDDLRASGFSITYDAIDDYIAITI